MIITIHSNTVDCSNLSRTCILKKLNSTAKYVAFCHLSKNNEDVYFREGVNSKTNNKMDLSRLAFSKK